jgi:hypothetical protein
MPHALAILHSAAQSLFIQEEIMPARNPRRRAHATPIRSWEDIRGYFAYRGIYDDYIKEATAGDIFIEIGNFWGKSLAYAAGALKGRGINIFGIDIGIDRPAQWHHPPRLRRGITSDYLICNLRDLQLIDEVTLIIRDSPKAAFLFPDRSVQFMMVDGDHSYAGVMRDLVAWWPKMKVGGTFTGDDYDPTHDEVIQAVNTFFGSKDLLHPRCNKAFGVIKLPDNDSGKPQFKLIT